MKPTRNTQNPPPSLWDELLQTADEKRERLPPGKGWMRYEELRESLALSTRRMRTLLQTAVASGRVETFRGSRLVAGGKLAQSVWYRPKKGGRS